MTATTPDPDPDLTAPAPADEVEAFADKVFGDLLGAMNASATTIGLTLGWYQALADHGSLNSGQLADVTSTDERYAREWLEHQTVAGYLDVIDPTATAVERCFVLSPAGAEVLTNRESLAYMAPFVSFLSTLGGNLDHLIEVYRTGDGFGWHQHGDGARCGQAEANRPLFLQLLATEYLPSIGDVHAKLSAGARVADIGCGMGWSAIGMANAYPNVTIDGYDIDAPSIQRAVENAADADLSDRVRFHTADVGALDGERYDLALALECIHDLPDPVGVLTAMRKMVEPGGDVIVMDERVGDVFTGESDPVEQMFYGFSLLCCLPDGRNAPTSAATGTVMRRPTFESYASEAGYSTVEVLPIENDFFRFYRLIA
jgi:2-polyprenyl-3-methyl-5-hydroxy-6-metoxy-1,4-benzoquinol methylase